jgi:hypothetical protein
VAQAFCLSVQRASSLRLSLKLVAGMGIEPMREQLMRLLPYHLATPQLKHEKETGNRGGIRTHGRQYVRLQPCHLATLLLIAFLTPPGMPSAYEAHSRQHREKIGTAFRCCPDSARIWTPGCVLTPAALFYIRKVMRSEAIDAPSMTAGHRALVDRRAV